MPRIKENNLTPKQEKFISEYIKTGNATKSAIKAGYSKKTAYVTGTQNLAKLSPEINKRMKAKKSKLIAQEDEVLEFYTKVMRGKMKDENVVVVNTGDFKSSPVIVETKVTIKERIKAAVELGKRYGLSVERIEVTTNNKNNVLMEVAEQLSKPFTKEEQEDYTVDEELEYGN